MSGVHIEEEEVEEELDMSLKGRLLRMLDKWRHLRKKKVEEEEPEEETKPSESHSLSAVPVKNGQIKPKMYHQSQSSRHGIVLFGFSNQLFSGYNDFITNTTKNRQSIN